MIRNLIFRQWLHQKVMNLLVGLQIQMQDQLLLMRVLQKFRVLWIMDSSIMKQRDLLHLLEQAKRKKLLKKQKQLYMYTM